MRFSNISGFKNEDGSFEEDFSLKLNKNINNLVNNNK